MIEKFLKRSSWIDIIISLIFVLFGILFIAKPEETKGALSIILGIIVISIGILKLVEYYSTEKKQDYLLTIALIAVIAGVVILFASEELATLFRIIIGIWIIVAGIMDFQIVLAWREVKSPYWTTTVILSILMMLAGLIIVTSKEIVDLIFGSIIVVYGVFDIIDRIIFMKKISAELKD